MLSRFRISDCLAFPDKTMVPTDHIQFPFRWLFVPVRDPRDGSVRWKWSAQTQTGEPAMASTADFDSLTECMADARKAGYDGK